MGSPPSRRATNLTLSSMTEHSFHGIHFLPKKRGSVTYVSGTICCLCLGSLTSQFKGERNCDEGQFEGETLSHRLAALECTTAEILCLKNFVTRTAAPLLGRFWPPARLAAMLIPSQLRESIT